MCPILAVSLLPPRTEVVEVSYRGLHPTILVWPELRLLMLLLSLEAAGIHIEAIRAANFPVYVCEVELHCMSKRPLASVDLVCHCARSTVNFGLVVAIIYELLGYF